MAKEKAEWVKQQHQQLSYIAVPSQIIRSLSASSLQSLLLLSPPKKSVSYLSSPSSNALRRLPLFRNIKFLLLLLFAFVFVGTLRLAFNLDPVPLPCSPLGHWNNAFSSLSSSSDSTLAITGSADSETKVAAGAEFWRQPDGMGYKPCLDFSKEYRKQSDEVTSGGRRRRKKYLLVVVNGGLNQQRNQIVDAVVIARILGAVLVVPVLQVNQIWGDQRCRLGAKIYH